MAIIWVMLVVGFSLLQNYHSVKANFKALALEVRHLAAMVVAYYQGWGITPQHLRPYLKRASSAECRLRDFPKTSLVNISYIKKLDEYATITITRLAPRQKI